MRVPACHTALAARVGLLTAALWAVWPVRVAEAQFDSVRVDSVRPAPGERLVDIDPVTPGIQFRWCIRYTPFGGSQPGGTTRVDSASIAVQAPPQTLLYFRSRGQFPQVNQCGAATGGSSVLGDTATVAEKGSYEASISATLRFVFVPNPNNSPPVFAGSRGRFVSPVHVYPSAAVISVVGDSVRTTTQVHQLSVQHDLGPGQDIHTTLRGKQRVGGVLFNASSGDTTRTTDATQTVVFDSPILNGPTLLRYDFYTDSVPGLARGRDRAFVRAGVVPASTVIQQPFPAPNNPYPPRFDLRGRAVAGMYVRVAACSGCDALGDSVLVAADSSWVIPAVGWPNAGANTLSIVGRDSDGFTDSVSVGFPVAANLAPTVQITSPAVAPPGPGRDSLRVGVGENLNFTATGSDLDGSIVSWSWDFGNQTSSTLQNPGLRSYAAPGRYLVTVRAADDLGLFSVRDTLIVNVRVRPVVRIIEPADNAAIVQRADVAGRATPGATVTLTACFGCSAQGTTRVAAADSTWRFAAVQFAATAQLASIITTVSDTTTLGSADTARVTVIANQPPVVTRLSPGADSVRIAQGDSVFFAVSSTDPDGSIASRQWRRGVLAIGAADTLGWRVFPDTGNNVLGFRAVDNVGDSVVTRYVVRVVANAPPTALITSPGADTTVAVGDAVLFQGVVNDPDGAAAVLWDFGDGRSTQSPSPLPISYGTPGVYTVTLRGTDEFGRFDVDTVVVTVRARPVVRIIAPAGQASLPQRFDITGRASPGSTVRIAQCTACTTLDSARVAAADSSFTFAAVDWAQPGPANTLRLRVTDAFGFTDSVSVTFAVTANLAPVATITAPAADTSIQLGGTVRFVGTATDQDGPAPSVLWDFGDGRSATTLTPPNVTYNSAGTFLVTLRATDALGAFDVDTVRVTVVAQVNRRPAVTITLPATNPAIAVGDSITFTATATDPDGDPLRVRWTFAPGDTVIGASVPNRRFPVGGAFTVIVRATDPAGLFAEDSVTVTVGGRGVNVDVTSPGSATRVDGHDVVFVLRAMTTQDLRADVNGDGRVDRADLAAVRAAFGTAVPAAVRRQP